MPRTPFLAHPPVSLYFHPVVTAPDRDTFGLPAPGFIVSVLVRRNPSEGPCLRGSSRTLAETRSRMPVRPYLITRPWTLATNERHRCCFGSSKLTESYRERDHTMN